MSDQKRVKEAPPKNDDSKNFNLLPWFGLIAAILLSGSVGYLVGRQSAKTDATELAASGESAIAAVVAGENEAQSETQPSNADVSAVVPTPVSLAAETVTTLGDPDAPVTVVEFSDYQCPFCLRNFQQTWPQLKADYIDTGKVFYVFKDFPILSLHPVAQRVHEAAQCAGELGGTEAYWQAHDIFFTNQQRWADQPQPNLDNMLVELTGSMGLPSEEMRGCLDDARYAETVQADMAEGRALGVSGTPTFFINGYPIVGARPYEVFQTAISMAEEGTLADAFARPSSQDDSGARATTAAAAAQPVDVPLEDVPSMGDPSAPVTIVEYSDYQCPFCLRHFRNTMPLLKQYVDAGQVRYVFKDFPISSIHPQAQKAHEGARCAREMSGDEAYWEMHDLLFENQDAWAGSGQHVGYFKTLAGEMGLDQTAFDSCLDSGRYAATVSSDLAEGQRFGVTGTPSFFINGQRLVGAQPFTTFQRMIETLLAG